MSILTLLKTLASAKPVLNQSEISVLLNQQPDDVKHAILKNDNEALKNLISENRFYANETQVTTY